MKFPHFKSSFVCWMPFVWEKHFKLKNIVFSSMQEDTNVVKPQKASECNGKTRRTVVVP